MERFRFLSATQGVESRPRTLRAGHSKSLSDRATKLGEGRPCVRATFIKFSLAYPKSRAFQRCLQAVGWD